FNATLTVSNSGGSNSVATVPITVGSVPPVPVISSPSGNIAPVEPGTVISYSGSASDPEDGPLPGTSLQWDILLHHNTHVHASSLTTGYAGSFVAQSHGEGTYSYELVLTATDSSGLQAKTSVVVPVLPDTTPPTAPDNLAATGSGSSVADLSWTASTDSV